MLVQNEKMFVIISPFSKRAMFHTLAWMRQESVRAFLDNYPGTDWKKHYKMGFRVKKIMVSLREVKS